MTFSYQEITPQVKRPIIPLMIKSPAMVIFYDGLIDSGADYCIFSLEIAHKLGLKLLDKNKIEFIGVGKEMMEGFWGEVEVRIAGEQYKTKVIFAEVTDFGHGILGQKGFFDHFDVKLRYQKQVIEIEASTTGKKQRPN